MGKGHMSSHGISAKSSVGPTCNASFHQRSVSLSSDGRKTLSLTDVAGRESECSGNFLCKGALWNEGVSALWCYECYRAGGCLCCTDKIYNSTNQAQICKFCNFSTGETETFSLI